MGDGSVFPGSGANTDSVPGRALPPYAAPRRYTDLFGQQVVVTPVEKLARIWTYGVAESRDRTGNDGGGDGVATTVDGALHLTSGTVDGGVTWLTSRDHPRYDPDCMFGLQTATPSLPIGSRVSVHIGLLTEWEGVYVVIDCFAETIKGYTRRTTGVVAPGSEDHSSGLGAAVTTDTLAFTAALPAGADMSYATLWDILTQWRGVGNQMLLVNLEEAGASDRLGKVSGLWSGNPALPIYLAIERQTPGDNAAIEFGCARVCSWDGSSGDDEYTFLPLNSETVASIDGTERPILVIQAAGFLAGMPCTRDHQLVKLVNLSVSADTIVRVRHNATVSNTGVTWSIPEDDRGIVMGIGSNTATVSGGHVHYEAEWASGTSDTLVCAAPVPIRPIPGTVTAGVNRGDPVYGGLIVITAEKASGTASDVATIALIGSKF